MKQGIKLVSGGLDLIDNICEGLQIFKKCVINVRDDIQITEVGNCLCVWGYYNDFTVPPKDIIKLNELGWHYNKIDGWLHGLSG